MLEYIVAEYFNQIIKWGNTQDFLTSSSYWCKRWIKVNLYTQIFTDIVKGIYYIMQLSSVVIKLPVIAVDTINAHKTAIHHFFIHLETKCNNKGYNLSVCTIYGKYSNIITFVVTYSAWSFNWWFDYHTSARNINKQRNTLNFTTKVFYR